MKSYIRQFSRHILSKVCLIAIAGTMTLGIAAPFASAQDQDFAPVSEKSFKGFDIKAFTGEAYTGLRPGITDAQISKMTDPFLKQLAASMKNGTYNLKARARTYEAYEPVGVLMNKLKTSGYSQFENPTGIYFEENEPAVLYVMGLDKDDAKLKIHNFDQGGGNKDSMEPLKNGLNIIKAKNAGLGYISYYTENYQKAPKLAIHIMSGKVNGVFDSKINNDEDWKNMLNNAVCDVIDIVGKHVHLVYPVEKLKQSNPDKGLEMINLYDQIINSQHVIMGLVKYNIQPKNRMFGRVAWGGFMFADGIGAGFGEATMGEVANVDVIPKSSWGIAHEFGHVNQTRPVLKWVSTGEVTNNIYAAWANYMLNPTNMRLEAERINGGDGNVIGGRFNAYLNAAIVNGQTWLKQKGPDQRPRGGNSDLIVEDHFVKLGPLWQLQLYFMAAKRGNPDFLADVFQASRAMETKGKKDGDFQLAFMKNVCDATKQDLSDFFVKTGMLKPIDEELDDYSIARLTITKNDCENLIKYARKYPKPESPVIYYISVNSVDAYKNKLPVEGQYKQGIKKGNNTLTVSHKTWKNVAVFETYEGDKLIKIAMVGTDSPDNSSTLVQYPQGATRVEAVAWNGKRTLVYGERSNK